MKRESLLRPSQRIDLHFSWSRALVRRMYSQFIVLAFCILPPAVGSAATQEWCGANASLPALRVFATAGSPVAWQEYANIGGVPDSGSDEGISAELWKGVGGSLLIRTVEAGEDFWTYTEYCFNNSGHLRRVKFEVRTAWGWAYRVEGTIKNRAVHALSSGFIETKTEKTIPRPPDADNIPGALSPTLYLHAKRLPFSKLLNADPKSGSAPTPQ
jgi:hypothetical protein